MPTQLIESPRNKPHIPADAAGTFVRTSRSPNLIERIALHVGIALIIWGRHRSNPRHDHGDLLRRRNAESARERRERAFQRNWSLTTPGR